MKKIDIWTSLFLMLLAVAICVCAYRLSIYGRRGPGPGFVSFSVGIILFLLSFAVLLKNLLRKANGEFKAIDIGNWKVNASIVCAITFYAFILERLGFILSTFSILLVLFGLSKKMNWYIVVGSSILVACMSYLLFSFLLGIALPVGILTFLR